MTWPIYDWKPLTTQGQRVRIMRSCRHIKVRCESFPGERFSLKIRSWVQPDWAENPLVNPDIVNAVTGKIEKKIKSRGLFDSFLSEYAHFILHRRMYRVQIECSAAQVADVPNHWDRRFRINGLVGFINKLSYTLHAAEGLKDLEVEFFVL